ncbi:ubiquitin-like-specific protease 1A [Arachis hypogaea]|nr:ubiquitin-like-specific protease 1A [Arachis hypogaea]
MGFSSIKAIQDWKIDRRLFLALAKAYNTTTSKLELLVGDIDVTTDKIGLALGLPSIGKSFLEEEDWTLEQKRLVAPFKSVTNPWLQEIIYYHKDTFGDKENYMGPPPPWIAYWDKEKLAKKLTQESSKQRPTGIVTLLVKQGGVDAKFAKNTTRAPTNLAKKRRAKELNKDNTMKEKKERFDEQNNDNKMSREDDNVSDEQKDKESDAKQDEEKEVKTREDKKDENNMRSLMRSPMRSPSNMDDAIKPEWREIVQSAVQAFLEIEDCDIYTPSPIKKTKEPVGPSIPSFSLMIDEENKIGEEKKVIDEKNKIGEEEKVIEDNKLTEVDKDKIYFWATDDRLNKDETLCILKDIPRAMLVREDIMSMLPRHQINNMVRFLDCNMFLFFFLYFYVYYVLELTLDCKMQVLNYMVFFFNKLRPPSFDVYCINVFVLLLVPCCYDYHWWLYAYDIYENRLFVLDSLYKKAKGDRVHLDIYASKLIQQMVSIAVPNYELPKNDPIPIYLNLPRQSNNYDCRLFVIKWVEMWNPSSIEINVSNMPEWEEFECVNLRKQLVI